MQLPSWTHWLYYHAYQAVRWLSSCFGKQRLQKTFYILHAVYHHQVKNLLLGFICKTYTCIYWIFGHLGAAYTSCEHNTDI